MATDPGHGRRRCIAAISPHAGYRYSGHVAGALFGTLLIPDRVIVLSVNHRGHGKAQAIWHRGGWNIPGACVPIDEPLADALLARCDGLVADTEAHLDEHSCELLLPFLHHANPHVQIVPIALRILSAEQAIVLGQQIAQVVQDIAPGTLLLASTDLNHHEDHQTTLKKDALAVGQILALDPKKLYNTVSTHRISMCGIVPTTVTIAAAKALGAQRCQVVKQATSGDVDGGRDSVVGYASVIID